MECMVAGAPGLRTLFLSIGDLLGLALDAGLHDVVLANGAVVDVDVPGPQSNCVPLLDDKSGFGFHHADFFLCTADNLVNYILYYLNYLRQS